MEHSLSVLFIFSSCFYCLLCAFQWLSPSLRNVPGPSIAKVSRLWHMYHLVKGDFVPRLLSLHENNGEWRHFVRIAHNEISISHPDAVTAVLKAPLRKAPWYKIMAVPDYTFDHTGTILDPVQRQKRFRLVAGGYSTANLLRIEQHMDSVVLDFIKLIGQRASLEQSFDISPLISFLTYDFIGTTIFSAPFGFLEAQKDVGNAISNLSILNIYIVVAGFMHWAHKMTFGNPVISKLSILPMGHLFDTTTKALANRLDQPKGAEKDMLSHWLRAQNSHPDELSLRHVFAQTAASVGAGADTISAAIQVFVYHMVQHPEYYQRAHDEIAAALGQGRCKDPVISFADAQALSFTQACIKEALRVLPPFSLNLAREIGASGLNIGGIQLPAGCLVSVNPSVVHLSTELWGADAKEFRPDRWFAADIAAKQKHYIPFGVGYGSCPGQNLARIEVSKVCATLIRNFTMQPKNREAGWEWKGRVTLLPKELEVTVEKVTY